MLKSFLGILPLLLPLHASGDGFIASERWRNDGALHWLDSSPRPMVATTVGRMLEAFEDVVAGQVYPASAKSTGRGCVGNLVWFDADGDGRKTADESSVPGSLVTLRGLSGNVVDIDRTPNGYYELCAPAGDYVIELDVPAGYRITLADQGDDEFHDSDAGSDGRIAVEVLAGRRNGRFDFGLVRADSAASIDTTAAAQSVSTPETDQSNGCVGDLVWEDVDGDGRHQSSEPGLSGVSVALHDASGSLVDSSVTTNGSFRLCAPAGRYEIRVAVPDDMSVTARDIGSSDTRDSDAMPNGRFPVDVEAGYNRERYDIGLVQDVDSSGNDSISGSSPTVGGGAVVGGGSGGGEEVLFGPWVQSRHRMDGVFQRFNAAQTIITVNDAAAVLGDARRTGTRLFVQLGTGAEWGWDEPSFTSRFTVAKWKRAVDRFGTDPALRRLLGDAIADGTIRGVYLIDEPHHARWSPGGNSNTYISNADLDDMAAHVKSYWPNARTSVRSSPRTLVGYGRERINWRHLDEAFIMIQYRKWANHGSERTIEAFMERELRDAHAQGLDVIGSIQMLIGAPTSNREFWPSSSDARPVGKLKVSPIELERYVEAFLERRNRNGEIDRNGAYQVRDVMVFRWDRNGERDWQNPYYDQAITKLVRSTSN